MFYLTTQATHFIYGYMDKERLKKITLFNETRQYKIYIFF